MPRASELLDEHDPTTISEAPEAVKICLPSHLPPSARDELCVEGLPLLEFRSRRAQAYDALDLIRRLRGVYQTLIMKNRVHVSTSQGTMTKSRSLFTNFTLKIDQAAARYRDTRAALLRLDPDEKISHWRGDIQELRREDIRGPSRESDENSESRQQPSWIWQTSSLSENTGINDPQLQGIMRVEWCKATARAERFREEVELVTEEMRRTLLFFKWTAGNWEQLGTARDSEEMDEGARAGIKAYAARKAVSYRRLIEIFVQDWYECLKLKSLGSSWLSDYPCPNTSRRRWLQSNVKAYHPSVSAHIDEADEALATDPSSEIEMGSTDAVDNDEADFFDDLQTPPSDHES